MGKPKNTHGDSRAYFVLRPSANPANCALPVQSECGIIRRILGQGGAAMPNIVDQVSLGAIVVVRDRLLEQQAQGRKILRLESGDPSFNIPTVAREAMEKALRDGLTHYTASTGIVPLREAIFRKVTGHNGLKVASPDQVVVTNGAMHGLYVIFRALLES